MITKKIVVNLIMYMNNMTKISDKKYLPAL